MKILLPVVSTEDSQNIVDFVIRYHWPDKSCIKILHVIGAMESEQACRDADKKANRLLKSVEQLIKKSLPEMKIDCEIISGDPTLAVIETATTWNAEMIVMGYRVKNDIKSFLVGSVSKGVAAQAPCSVAIIRQTTNNPVVPVR